MKVGPYRVSVHNHGFFRLDGGAMFGVVPKPLWAKQAPPDDENRILLATRSMVIEGEGRKVLVDVGCGDKWTEKSRAIYCISDKTYEPVPGVTDVILTHMHFDHGGAISRFSDGGIVPNYPDASHYISATNLANAKSPNLREKASYLPENVGAFDLVRTVVTDDGQEILPGMSVHIANGHTTGLQWVKLTDGKTTLVYPADMMPTSKHLPIAFVMGYDMCAERAMAEKADFLRQAVEGNWIVVFEHDPEIDAGRIAFDEKGRPVISEVISFPHI